MQSGKARFIYKVNKKGPSNTSKMDASVKILKKLGERIKKEGHTKWLTNAVAKIELRMKKYGFDTAKLKNELNITSAAKAEKKTAKKEAKAAA